MMERLYDWADVRPIVARRLIRWAFRRKVHAHLGAYLRGWTREDVAEAIGWARDRALYLKAKKLYGERGEGTRLR
jgi:hypothetical protein